MQVNDSLSLGQAIRNRRKELSYTQKYISEITGFSMSFLSDLENGKATCEIGRTLHIMNLLGLNLTVEARSQMGGLNLKVQIEIENVDDLIYDLEQAFFSQRL